MDGYASTVAPNKLRHRPDRTGGCLRSELERDYEAAYGRPVRNYLQLDLLERAASWLLRSHAVEGRDFQRSLPQIARGCGYPKLDTMRDFKLRQESSIKRMLGYLREMGWIESWEAVYGPKGESTGIGLRVGPRAVSSASERRSSSAGNTSRRRSAHVSVGDTPARGSLFSRTVLGGPSREHHRCCPTEILVKGSTAGVRAAAAHVARHELANPRALARGAALNALRSATRGLGRAALSAAVDAGGDALAVAVVAWEISGVAAQAHPALTARRRLHLERYCAIAGRLLGAGAGERFLLDVILGHQAATGGELVYSLDYFVCQLRKWVRQTRRSLRGLPPLPHERAGWWEEREERREHAARVAQLKPRGGSRARRR